MSQTQQNSRKTARKISKTDFYFVTGFYSLDDICIAFLRHPYYLLRHKRGDVATCLYGVADERAADVIESGVEEADGRGKGGDVDVATRARIDGDGVVGDDLSLTKEFVRMGMDELSVSPASILPLRKKIRSL